ncbi:MAG: PSD1 and planctomycete cytochrome C domain-containing protein [Planctomycetota bacterium]
MRTSPLGVVGLLLGAYFFLPAPPEHAMVVPAFGSASGADTPERISFNRQIRPILSDNCFACHGPDPETRASGLRLDIREDAVTFERGDGRAIVPGDHRSSAVYRRVTSGDADEVMPPPETHKSISPEQAALLAAWIDQGAEYEPHWAYVAPTRPGVPEVRQADWPTNAIDAFVLARLEAESLNPSAEADPATLLRRVTRDLTGLPPTLAELDAFLSDPSEKAYAGVVDRLLASPAFGERLAIFWLDQVRYADTTGFHSDETQPVWAYRDYVVQAFNENLPFDRFTREQLAGDLLPDSGVRQKIASGFNRLNLTTAEGGAQPDEYLAKYMADRVRAVSNVWMAGTMACNECHDHKYDPYTLKDFYRMGAFFADVEQRAVYKHGTLREPSLEIPDESQRAELARLELAVKERQAHVDAALAEAGGDEAFARWASRPPDTWDVAEAADRVLLDDRPDAAVKEKHGKWDFVTADEGPVRSGSLARRQQADRADRTVQHYFKGLTPPYESLPSDRWFIEVWLDPEHPPKTVMLQVFDGGWEHRAYWGEDTIAFGGIGVTDRPKRRHMGPLPPLGRWVRLEVPGELLDLKRPVTGLAFTQHGGLAYWDRAGVSTFDPGAIPLRIAEQLRQPVAERSADSVADVRAWYDEHVLTQDPAVLAAKQAHEESERALSDYRKEEVYRTLITRAAEPAVTRVLPRGNWLDKSGEVVQPGIPEFMGELVTGDRRANRLDLADWLLTDDHPLTRRVFVNRLWKLYFGRGLSAVLDDLGSQGHWPSHPELLDWLAVEFGESGWDVKHMIRLMVMSRTYRQASLPRRELDEVDVENHLLGRQARYRVEAELIRDHALAVSGLLHDEMGGPPAMPYQPEGHWDHLNFPRRTYQADEDSSQYRRGLYMHWQRTFLHPMLRNFDAPSREECTAERVMSNTPLQALTLLNDPTFVEAARVFAERIMDEGGQDVSQRIHWAFRVMVARDPSTEESRVLESLYDEQHARYVDRPDAASALLGVGLSASDESLDPVELAAWTAVARTLLNLHETITRD